MCLNFFVIVIGFAGAGRCAAPVAVLVLIIVIQKRRTTGAIWEAWSWLPPCQTHRSRKRRRTPRPAPRLPPVSQHLPFSSANSQISTFHILNFRCENTSCVPGFRKELMPGPAMTRAATIWSQTGWLRGGGPGGGGKEASATLSAAETGGRDLGAINMNFSRASGNSSLSVAAANSFFCSDFLRRLWLCTADRGAGRQRCGKPPRKKFRLPSWPRTSWSTRPSATPANASPS